MVSFIVLMSEANGRLSTDDNFYSVSLSGYRILKQLCAQCIIFKSNNRGSYSCRPLIKSAYQKINFLKSQPKQMLWILKRTVPLRRFF